MRPATTRLARRAFAAGRATDGERIVPEEVPVALVYDGGTEAVMMASPADLEDFATGFSVTEGIVASPSEIGSIEIVEEDAGIELRMWLAAPRAEALAQRRRRIAGPTGCGLCGIDSLEEAVRPPPVVGEGRSFSAEEISAGLRALAAAQVLGRETRAAITEFLAERKLPANTSMGELIDILEDIARKRSMQVGMMLCNRTGNKIVAAMARFRPDGLESRGWWTIEANLCVRTVDESLITAPHYVFAEMATPQGVRLLKGAATKFCTSRAQFAILGNENCEQRRYRSEKFVETAAPEEGKLVYEFFDSAFAPPVRPQP